MTENIMEDIDSMEDNLSRRINKLEKYGHVSRRTDGKFSFLTCRICDRPILGHKGEEATSNGGCE
jgi:hypothetical protein